MFYPPLWMLFMGNAGTISRETAADRRASAFYVLVFGPKLSIKYHLVRELHKSYNGFNVIFVISAKQTRR